MQRPLTARLSIAAAVAALAVGPALAATVRGDLDRATPSGPGASVGTAAISDGPNGAVITLDLHGLPPGQHGMHVHEKASCAPGPGPDGKVIPAGAAGSHWDPGKTGHHLGPEGMGHMGDLPKVEVTADGTFKGSLIAPHITDVSALKNRTLMIHVGGDNYSDIPPLGGGGARYVCAVLH
jgi:Cu-Zn family superoxide dismutase